MKQEKALAFLMLIVCMVLVLQTATVLAQPTQQNIIRMLK